MVDARKKKVYDEIYRELEELAMKDDHLLDAFNVWEELSQSPEDVIAYQSRLKYILDEEAKYDHARHEGKKEGIEQGVEQGIEQGVLKVAKELIALDLDIETIQKATGLSKEEIDVLKE